MVAGMTAYVFYWQGEEGRNLASHKIASALNRVNADFAKTQMANRDFANRLSRDQALIEALSKQDRAAISSILKNASDARGFAGYITTIDEYGRVIYSSDTPAKFGYTVRGKSSAVDYVLNNQDSFTGPTNGFTTAEAVSLSAMVPIVGSNGQPAGLVAVSEPLDEEFLTGEAIKLGLMSDPLSDIDFVLLGVKDRSQIYMTPGLLKDSKDRPAYLRALSDQGVRALPNWQEPGQIGNISSWFNNLFNKNSVPGLMTGFVQDNRFWQPFTLSSSVTKPSARVDNGSNNTETVGVILATTPIQAQGIKPGFVIIASCIMGLAAVFSIVALSTQLSGQPDGEMTLLIERVKRWRADKHVPPGKKLTGPWQELSDLIDQTFIEWQSTIQGLKLQIHKAQPQEGQGEKRKVDDEQFDALNRQLANQSRQLSEFSRQLNHANQQAVFLQHELDAILQSTTEGFLILDLYGNIIHANTVFLGWLGVSEAEIAGRYCFDLVRRTPPNSNPTAKAEMTPAFVKPEASPGALINQFFPEGFIHNSQSDKSVEVVLHLQPVSAHDNRVSGYILVVRDKSLRSEIAGLKMEIITMLARAVRGPLISADREWQHVLSAQNEWKEKSAPASSGTQDTSIPEEVHEQLNRELNQELKKPEITFAQRLENLHSRYENLIKSVEGLLTAHGQSIGQMVPLTNESGSFTALDLESILATAEPAKETFPLTRLIGECLQESSGLAAEKQLALDYKTSTALPNLTNDRPLVKSVLTPIIDHMISVTEAGGRVRVESVYKDNEIELSISSSGPALSEEETADMFSGFVAEKHSEDTYGTRLALYLSRNNAERLGANIRAQSDIGEGTTVYVTFPVA